VPLSQRLLNHTINLTFAAFWVFDGIMGYGRFKCVIEMNKFERLDFSEGRNVNIPISSMKIKVILPENYL
jgi:hypothetical protein